MEADSDATVTTVGTRPLARWPSCSLLLSFLLLTCCSFRSSRVLCQLQWLHRCLHSLLLLVAWRWAEDGGVAAVGQRTTVPGSSRWAGAQRKRGQPSMLSSFVRRDQSASNNSYHALFASPSASLVARAGQERRTDLSAGRLLRGSIADWLADEPPVRDRGRRGGRRVKHDTAGARHTHTHHSI